MTARWSVQVVDLGSGEVILSEEPDRLLPTASVGKLFLLVEVAARLVSGTLDPSRPLRRDSVPLVADSGLWQHLESPTLPLVDVAALVGAVSDNHATNVLLDLVGLDAVARRAALLAPGGSALLDVVRTDRGPGDPPALSVGCARDLVGLASALARGEVVDAEVSGTVVRWLAAGSDLSMVASALDLDPLAHTAYDGATWLWSKTGTNAGVRADVGVATARTGQVAWAALCAWDPAVGDLRGPALARMRQIGATVRGRLAGAPRG